MEKTIEKNCYKNNNNPFFSVIVPTYNVEEYVDECIKSVINQSFDNWELIIIDDGSTDNTADICKAYVQKNNQIIFIQNDHGMQAKARNLGIRIAKGQYICFLDSDDYWGLEHLENLKNCIIEAECPDMCIANQHTNIYENEIRKVVLFRFSKNEDSISSNKATFKSNQNTDKKTDEEISEKVNHIRKIIFAKENLVPGATVLNTYKNSFIRDNGICFDESLSLSEDLDFFMQGICKANSLCTYEKEFYFYRQTNLNSTIHSIDMNKLHDRLKVCQKWYDGFEDLLEQNIDDCSYEWMKMAQYKLAVQLRTTFHDVASQVKNCEKDFIKEIKACQYILRNEDLGSYFSEYTVTSIRQRIMHNYWILVDILKTIVHKWREYRDKCNSSSI